MQHNPPPPDLHDPPMQTCMMVYVDPLDRNEMTQWPPGQTKFWDPPIHLWGGGGGGGMGINWNSPIYVFVLRCWSLIMLILYLQAASRCLETLLPAEVASYHFTVMFVQWTQDEHCPSYIAPAYMWYPSLTPRRFPPPVPQATVGDMGMRLLLYMKCMQVGNSSAMKCYPLAMQLPHARPTMHCIPLACMSNILCVA